VVLKRVLAERARDPHFARMFLDEARLSAQLQHPNIAQVYDVGQLDGTYFYTMEYVHGEDLRRLLHAVSWRKNDQLPINLALYIASGALAALHHAHERTSADGTPLDIVHRDVSPSNVMIGFEGAVKLLDFGVAKASQRSSESQSGSFKGKVAYLSPEQIKGKGIDRRSDVYSLGIVLHEMLTCKRLYKRETDYITLMAITNDDVAPPSKSRPEVSPELDRIVMTALEKDRDRRYPSAAAMLEDIEALAISERHLLSATALARFMREQIGTRPEPWIELSTRDDSEPRTVTASNSGLHAVTVDSMAAGLKQQLEQAVDLRPIGRLATDTPVSADDAASSAPRSRRGLAFAAVAVVVVGAGAGVFVNRRNHGADQSAPVAQTTPPPAIASAVSPVPAAPPTIVELAARNEWNAAMQACSTTPRPTVEESKACALAACNAKQRAVAVRYYKASAGSDRAAIERGCAEHGVALAAPKTGARPPAKDPCKDPAYLDANPLKCM
jgi:serine/threonine protein kinase